MAVDETDEQTRAVVDYQNRKAAGLIDVAEERQLRMFLCSCARLLDRSKQVVNPYATAVALPAEASKLRTTQQPLPKLRAADRAAAPAPAKNR